MIKISFLCAVLLMSTLISAQPFSGKPDFWQKSDFLGFDEIGDCTAETGDISSVFVRSQGKNLLLRITFDNMVTRKDNEVASDHFAGRNISLRLKLTNLENRNLIVDELVDLAKLSQQTRNMTSLRTLDANLWEAELTLDEFTDRSKIEFSLAVTVDGQIADYFLSDGGPADVGGNCAFVHHGNQGITYTEVFYGSPGGQSGLDGSGFDEILQVHEATNVPGNFHMSGTLMPAAQWHNPEFNDWLHALAANGTIEMMTSALGQHIMPFVHNNMNDWSVSIENDMVDHHYNYVPRTAWVPERVWLAPGNYPDAGVTDWPGDNWAQHGVWGVVLDDSPHLNGYDNRKIHWMNNGSGINLRVIPINNSFVGNVMYNADGAKNQIAGMGAFNICVYGTDWEVAAEMNEHDGSFFLDNYENILWWCHDNYPGVNVWKTVDAMQNPDFNGTGAEITPGTYGLLGGQDGYGGSNNSWYTQWAATPSHSDFHEPKWNYGYIWDDAHNNLLTAPDNNLAQLGWYILMINLHETGWHDGGSVAGWEHRYSSHIKNANVYAHAARWADGQYEAPLAAYFDDIDHDGIDEMVIHNQQIFAVFESIGGKINWLFYKDGFGNAHSVVGSDMAYWAETDGDYNDGSNNHVAALSDVYPYQQDAIYEMNLIESSGDTVIVEFSQWGVKKRISLVENANYLDVIYDFFGSDGYVKSGFSPGLMDLIWSGKDHVQRIWGDYGSYCGQRNSASGATVALVLGDGGAQHNTQFEGTLVLGDEIKGNDRFFARLFAGYTSEPAGTTVPELNTLAAQNMDVFPPTLNATAFQVDNNTIELTFSEALEFYTAQDEDNYSLLNFSGNYTILNVIRQNDWRKVQLTIQEYWLPGDEGQVVVTGVEDLNGNVIGENNTATFLVPSGTTPHTISIDGTNDFDPETELVGTGEYSLYITWDNTNLYLGFENLDLNGGGDLFVNIDTDQGINSGAPNGSWGRVSYTAKYEAEYQVAIEGGGGSIQLNHYANGLWHYPANNNCESYEGWSGNGLSEISVPWASLGNPAGIALSVNVSEEDSQVITAAFPPQNPIGDHPTLTHVYAFYTPHITSEMPVAGMEPKNAVIMPNGVPEIIGYAPANLSQEIQVGQSVDFSIDATDPENDPLYFSWILDGEMIAETQNYTLLATADLVGMHALIAKVNDGIPGHVADSVVWQIEIVQDEVLMANFSSDVTTICVGSEVAFTDLSTGDVTARSWTFEGGTPATSNAQNPIVSYPIPGTFDVSLTVSDGIENHTAFTADYITVFDNPQVDAGADMETCENEPVEISGTASGYSSVLWISSGDGVFSNTSGLSTGYTPGAADALAGFAELTLTAYPMSPCPAAAMDAMTLTIFNPPAVTSQPQSQNVAEGTQVIFEISAEGTNPLSYSWFGPEGEIAGATTNQLVIENAGTGDAGNYYCLVENVCGEDTSDEATLTIEELLIQTINIPNGWNGISTRLNPANPLVADIFQDMTQAGNLVVLQNYEHLYWPGENINTIDLSGGWNYQSGYQVKVTGDQQITISGNTPESMTLTFDDEGWYLIPVLSNCNVAPESLLGEIMDDVVLIKEVAGLRLFWPGVFQNLYQLEPGKSYIAGFAAPVSFSFPECEQTKSETAWHEPGFSILQATTQPNPVSHALAFSGSATRDLAKGDAMLIENGRGEKLAEILLIKKETTIGLQVFGNDITTPEKDGFDQGDELHLRIIRNGKIMETHFECTPAYDDIKLKNNGMTEINAIGLETSIELTPTGDDIVFYPNPTKNILYFSDADIGFPVRIYTAHGDLIYEDQLIRKMFDVSLFSPGLYYVNIYQNQIPVVKKFIKQ